ncbi:MAG: phospho-sugar mutase [Oscillospiraceae bacterium]|nr:phospho-sugar mutase [Oscillospiraceae bacterium]
MWLENVQKGSELFLELERIKNNIKEINNRFNCGIKFGTAGVRGLIGAGTNRLNIFTIAKITQAVSGFAIENFKNPSVAIAFDTRKNSLLFANTAAMVFAANDLKVFVFDKTEPTPLLSFAVRYLGCSLGVMITASHNPAQYNGYKLYGEDGSQIDDVTEIYNKLENIDIFCDIKYSDFESELSSGKIEYIKNAVKKEYIKNVLSLLDESKLNNLSVTYSPLNGCAGEIFCGISKNLGIKLNVVKKQEFADENFTTCKIPNPEKKEAFGLSFKLAEEKKSNLIILNDPDGDRMSAAVKNGNDYTILSGNEVAALFLNYIIEKKPKDFFKKNKCVIIKSIVSGGLTDEIARENGIEIIKTLTGFKHIGKQIRNLESKNEINRFLIGFEESCGYLLDSYIRDKDGIAAGIKICEITNYYMQENLTLLDVLKNLYNKFGYYIEKTIPFSIKFDTEELQQKFENISTNKFENFGFFFIDKKIDKIAEENQNKNNIFIRASGTEPILKFYILANGKNKSSALLNFQNMKDFVLDFCSKI